MGDYNFDIEINRKNTNSLKWDFAKERGKKEDILPFWVADMDFKLPNEVIDSLVNKSKEGVFGYSDPKGDYYNAIIDWYKNQYDVILNPKSIIVSPSVVFSICTLIKIITKENDSIIINEPVYYPFKSSILVNNRKAISSDLVIKNDKYVIDFDDFEEKIKNNNVKAYVLCSPHNPVGRVWDLDELEKIVEICNKYNVFIISDEIHGDFAFNKKFISIAKLNPNNYAIVSGPTKSFNMPGLKISHAIVNDKKVFNDFLIEFDRIGYSQQSIMGLVGASSAYRYGLKWLNEVRDYIWNNIIFIESYLKEKLPKIKFIKPEGTYLIWLDFKAYNLSDKKLDDLISNKANLWLDAGIIFGKSGSGFERINVATQRSLIVKMLDNLYSVFKDL